MKVLWFTNSPSLAKAQLNQVSYGGGWMESLQEKIQTLPEIDLALSFYSENASGDFIQNNTHYFPLKSKKRNRFSNFIYRVSHKLEDESLEIEKFQAVIQKFQPDVIHIFGTEKSFGLIADQTKIPVIIWIQGNITVYNLKYHAGITKSEVSKFTSIKNKIKGFGFYHTFSVMENVAIREKKIFNKCKFFTGRTEWDRRITKVLAPDARYFQCDEMLRSHFYTQKYVSNRKENVFRIVSVLNPDIYKGFETILFTMHLLKTNFQKLNIHWKIVGVNGSEEVLKLSQMKLNTNAESINIEFAGKFKSDGLVPILLDSDLFVHPSHIENSPNSVCEAMILGMPIICTYAGGVSSLLENNKEGILIQDGDPYSLAGAILDVIENYERAIKSGEEARNRAILRHDPDKIINNLLNIYSELINEYTKGS